MTSIEKVKFIVRTLDRKKAADIRVIKIRDISMIADYFVIAGATSTTQVKALAEELEFKLKETGEFPLHTEGYRSANWVITDYDDVIVHIFHKETREFYSLEKLWADGENVPVDELL